MFTYDGKSYDVIVTSLKRKFSKLSTDKSGRVQSGEMFIDLIGVYYNYSMIVQANGTSAAAVAEYDRFWDDISAPKPFVRVSFPYNQSVLIFDAYVTQGEQDLITKNEKLRRTIWGATPLTFTAKEPQRRPL